MAEPQSETTHTKDTTGGYRIQFSDPSPKTEGQRVAEALYEVASSNRDLCRVLREHIGPAIGIAGFVIASAIVIHGLL